MNQLGVKDTNKLADTVPTIETTLTRYLVYMKTNKDPAPQLWYDDHTTGTGGFKHKPVGDENSQLVYFRKLGPEDDELDFHQLVAKYPCVIGFTKT